MSPPASQQPQFCAAQETAAGHRRRKRRERLHAIGFRLKLLYLGTLYRPHMRLIHRFGWHLFTRLPAFDGPAQKWCQWCGERHIIHPAIKVDGPLKRSA